MVYKVRKSLKLNSSALYTNYGVEGCQHLFYSSDQQQCQLQHAALGRFQQDGILYGEQIEQYQQGKGCVSCNCGIETIPQSQCGLFTLENGRYIWPLWHTVP